MAPSTEERPYTVYRARPRGLLARLRGEEDSLASPPPRDPGERRTPTAKDRGPITPKRVLKWVAIAIVTWLALSLVLFLISAQVERGKVSDRTKNALSGGGLPLVGTSTILVLGSDQRPKSSKEPGAKGAPQRSDSILLIRAGGGASSRLSIPRDTLVDIPGHGEQKINAAYAFGGPALAIRTVEAYTGIKINHVVLVSFTNFPKLIDALGGVDMKTPCIHAEISGGVKNGGQTIRLSKGVHHLDGKTALAVSRIRENSCVANYNDIDRAKAQQALFAAMKSRLVSPGAFIRLPFISWAAPKALRTDMGGISLLGLFGALAVGGSSSTQVLVDKHPEFVNSPVGDGITVSAERKRAAIRKFLGG